MKSAFGGLITDDHSRKRNAEMRVLDLDSFDVSRVQGGAESFIRRRRRQFFLYGTSGDSDIIYNRIESHLDLVGSFLYSPDHAEFSLSAPANASDAEVKQFMAAQDAFNNDFRDAGCFRFLRQCPGLVIGDGHHHQQNGLVGRERGRRLSPWSCPGNSGYLPRKAADLESQPAFVHTYYIDYDNACQRLMRAGLANKIDQLNVVNTPFESPFPEMVTRMIIASTSGENLSGNVTGSVNPSYVARPSYVAKINRPLVAFHELTVWDDECEDYRVFFMVDPGIILSDSKRTIEVLKKAGSFKAARKDQEQFYNTTCNPFFPKDHPYVQICPYGIYEYFWGKAHIESLIPLRSGPTNGSTRSTTSSKSRLTRRVSAVASSA